MDRHGDHSILVLRIHQRLVPDRGLVLGPTPLAVLDGMDEDQWLAVDGLRVDVVLEPLYTYHHNTYLICPS